MKNIFNAKYSSNVLIITITSLLLFIVCVNQPIDPDMWWHLQNGQLVFTEGSITTIDLFSFTKYGQPWTNAFWLSDLLIFCLFKLGGFSLLVSFFAILGSLTYMMIFFISPGPYLLRAFLVVLAAISTAPEWTIRPQVFSFLFFAILNVYLIKNLNLKWKNFLWLPFLFLFWVNIHGGYIWGFLLLIAVIVGSLYEIYIHKNESSSKSAWKRFSLIVIVSFVFVLINPNGFAMLRLPFQTIDVSITSIVEWSSPNFHDFFMQPFLWVVLLFIASLSFSENRLTMDQLLKVLGFLFLAFVSQRNIPLAVIVIMPILIEKANELVIDLRKWKQQDQKTKQSIKGSGFINFFIILIVVFVCVLRVKTQIAEKFIRGTYPVNAVRWIRENNPKGNMLNSYNWGGYLIYNLPEYKVFIDGRADLYGKELISTWWRIVSNDHDAINDLNTYKINFLLVEPNQPIVEELLAQNWKIAFEDELSIIVTR